MKILMLVDSMGRGGTERRLTELLKVLTCHHDFDVELVVFSDRIKFQELYQLNLKIHIFKRRTKKDLKPSRQLFLLCQKIQPDIIHSWGSMASVFSIPIKIWNKTTLINSIIVDAPHRMTFLDDRFVRMKLTAPFSDIILANSYAGLNAYSAPKQKSQVIYNGYDFKRLEVMTPVKEVKQKWNVSDKKIIGMVGAFEPRKDYKTLIRLANRMLSEREDLAFVAVGGGSMLESLRSQVDAAHRDRFIFTGTTSQVEDIIQIFDVGVLISNSAVHGEGISNAIMEYMAQKKPVIANNNGGNSEIIEHGKTGFILHEQDEQSWINKLNFLLDEPTEAMKMGQLGHERIVDKFHIDKMVNSFIDLYRNIIVKAKIELDVSHQVKG